MMLMWSSPPKTVLLLKKMGDSLLPNLVQAISFLQEEGMTVVLEYDVKERLTTLMCRSEDEERDGVFSDSAAECVIAGSIDVEKLEALSPKRNDDRSMLHLDDIDLVVCLGGDGVILHASSLFQESVPPVLCFNLGSMGFMATYVFEDFEEDMKRFLHGDAVSI